MSNNAPTSYVVATKACPVCVSLGKDSSRDNLKVYSNGSEYCFSCNKAIKLSDDLSSDKQTWSEKDFFVTEYSKEDWFEDIQNYTTDPHGYRGLKKSTCDLYRVFHELEQIGDQLTVIKQYYPISKENEFSGVKVRIVHPSKNFKAKGYCKADCDLFGQALFQASTSKWVVIASGELDALSAYQMLNDNREVDSKFPVIPVVSGTAGEASSLKQYKNNYEFLDKFETIYIIPDKDEKGEEALHRVAQSLPKDKLKVIDLPAKDANAMLESGRSKDFVNAFWKAKFYSPAGIIGSDQIYEKMLEKATIKKVEFPPFLEKLNEKTAGGMPIGSIINITGGCVDGKTEFLTPTGWKEISKYTKEDLVAQYDEDSSISFVKPSVFHKYRMLEDEFFSVLENEYYHQILSSEHDSYLYNRETEEVTKLNTINLIETITKSKLKSDLYFKSTFTTNSFGLDVSDELLKLKTLLLLTNVQPVIKDSKIIFNNLEEKLYNYLKKEFVPIENNRPNLVQSTSTFISPLESGYFYNNYEYSANPNTSMSYWFRHGYFDTFTNSSSINYNKKAVQKSFNLELDLTEAAQLNDINLIDLYNLSDQQVDLFLTELYRLNSLVDNKVIIHNNKKFLDIVQFNLARVGITSTIDKVITTTDFKLNDNYFSIQIHSNPSLEKIKIRNLKSPDGFKYCFTVDTGKIILRSKGKIFITGNSGVGKCLAPGTMIRMADFSLKPVEEIKIGDRVLRPDGGFNTVLNLSSGNDTMYEIKQSMGMTYTINSSHILSLKTYEDSSHNIPPNFVLNLPVKMFLALPQELQTTVLKGWKVDFNDDNYNTILSTLEITEIGVGEYYGFELDGDHLFCLEDGTVTHNSTIANDIVNYHIQKQEYGVGIVSLEADAGDYGENLISSYIQKKLHWVSDPEEKLKFLQSDEVKDAISRLFFKPDGTPSFHLIDDRGDYSALQTKIEELIISCDCTLILIDVLSDVFEGESLEFQTKWMAWEKAMVKRYPIIFLNVVHTRKPSSGQKTASNGGSMSEEDMVGSSSIYKSANINLILQRNKLAEDETIRNIVTLNLTKNRTTGWSGEVSKLYYDSSKHVFIPLEEWFELNPDEVEKLGLDENDPIKSLESKNNSKDKAVNRF